MGWVKEEYFYRIGTLKAIAYGYECLYSDAHLASLFSVAESKADFDRALNSIGRGNWKGTVRKFDAYKYYGAEQQTVIADIVFGKENATKELQRYGFYNISQLRHEAYKRMAAKLNGKKI